MFPILPTHPQTNLTLTLNIYYTYISTPIPNPNKVKKGVEDSISTLLRFREEDPYREAGPRFVYEGITGRQV